MPASLDAAIDFAWTKTENGFCAEMSTLQGNGLTHNGYCTLPDGNTAHRSLWIAHRDPEGEVTHWTYAIDGTVYEIFND